MYDETRQILTCERLDEQYVRLRHSSGLTVLISPKRMHTISAALVVRYGAMDTRFALDDAPMRTYPRGVAHYLEHQLFDRGDGTSVDSAFAALGVDVNAWTNYERTAYVMNASENVYKALELLLRFVYMPAFGEASVEKERGIIEQEIRMVEDDPWELLHRQTVRNLYPHHPIIHGICGSVDSIAHITAQTLYDAHTAFYRPENMYLTVCGDVCEDEVMRTVDAVLASACQSSHRVTRGVRGAYDSRKRVLPVCRSHATVSKPIFTIAWRDDHAPLHPAEREAYAVKMDLISELLFSRAGAFYNRLVDRDLITNAYSYGMTVTGSVAYHAISGESDDVEAVYDLYRQMLRDVHQNGFAAADLERNRRVCYATFVSDFDDTDDICDLMLAAEGDGVGAFDRLGVIDTLQPQDITALFASSFDEQHTTLSVLYPNEQGAM